MASANDGVDEDEDAAVVDVLLLGVVVAVARLGRPQHGRSPLLKRRKSSSSSK